MITRSSKTTGGIVNVSPFSASAAARSQSSRPVNASSARRYPSEVPRMTMPSFRATPRLCGQFSLAFGLHTCRHWTRQVAASSAIVAWDVVRYMIPR